MRLRVELLDSSPQRERLLGDLQSMQSLVEEGLAYARSAHGVEEAVRTVDLHALLDSIALDYADAGSPVRLSAPVGATVVTRPNALKRIVVNLLDNALKFGTDVEIELRATPSQPLTIAILDKGPGIPADELESVFEPFHRVESSRSRETGGTGLGLAIARKLAESIGAEIRLANRPSGGLEARATLSSEVN
jgi:signal transduction histidine kinase